jgi:site-specific recombinase XerD
MSGACEIDPSFIVVTISGRRYRLVLTDDDGGGITVDQIVERHRAHALVYYRHPDGSATHEHLNFEPVYRLLIELFGPSPGKVFGCKSLKQVRQRMIELGWSRKPINKQIVRIRTIFRWAAEEELLPGAIYQQLRAVAPLKRGRSNAKETRPVRAVRIEIVRKTLLHVTPTIRDVANVQRLTGARPDEILSMRASELDRSAPVWKFAPEHHKNAFREQDRVILIGPRAQAILRRYLKPVSAAAIAGSDEDYYLFSPARSEERRRAELHDRRVTPAGQGNGIGTHRADSPRRRPGERYRRDSYYHAIQRGITLAFQPSNPSIARRENEPLAVWMRRLSTEQRAKLAEFQKPFRWSPNHLRHTRATEVRSSHGAEAVGALLGHKTTDMVAIYAEIDEKNLAAIVRKTG